MRSSTRLCVAAAVVSLGCPGLAGAATGVSVDRGFVFFDGEYIEAPYAVEARDLAVTINGIQITDPLEWPPLEEYLFDHDPGFPQGLPHDADLGEALGVREPGGVLFDAAKQWYLFSHLDYDEAYSRMEGYYRSLPCVKDLYKDDEGFWVLESHGGEQRRIAFGGSRMRLLNEMYGPEGTGEPSLEEYEERVERRRARFEERLLKGDLFLLFPGGEESSFSERKAANLLPEILGVLRSAASEQSKSEELYSLDVFPPGDDRHALRLIRGFRAGRQLDERLSTLRESIAREYGEEALRPIERDAGLKTREAKEERLNMGEGAVRGRGVAYSPDGQYVYGYCAYTYDAAFTGFDGEVAAVGDYVKNQDFSSTLWIYKDSAGQNSDPETATYSSFKDMKYADLLYLACHGWKSTDGGYIEMILLETQAQVNTWSGNDATVTPVEITTENWPTGHPWAACATSAWPTAKWKTILDQSKAINILSCCYSHENGWTGACGGAVSFGYNISTTGAACEANNLQLLKRMNGSLGDGKKRKAYLAYNDMPSHEKQFRITPANAEATLAPAPEKHDPEDEELVDTEGTGYFQVDTYCDASIAATDALTFNTSRDVTISNVHWIGSDRVNRIEFDWEGEGDFEVEVTAHADKFQSWGATSGSFHKLDGDCKDPNGDDYTYTFKARPRSIVFVIDDTGSMSDEIASVRATLLSLIDSFEAAEEDVLYTLITYKDNVSLDGQTQDPDQIRSWVSALYASGGGDCPEEGCGALLMAAGVAPDSEAWWMTDADVHGGWASLAFVRAILWAEGVRVHSVIMGSCWYDECGRMLCRAARSANEEGEACEMRGPRDQVNSYEAASYISEGTGGLYFPVSSPEVPAATQIVLEEMQRTTVSCVYNKSGTGTYTAPIDASATVARFLVNPLSAATPDVAVRNPSGAVIDTASAGVSMLSAGDTEYWIVQSPALAQGDWTVEVGGTIDDHVFRCSLESPLTFDYLGESAGGVGVPMDIVVDMDGSYPTPSFFMVESDGSSSTSVSLYDDGLHGDGDLGDGRYGGTFAATESATYRVSATGSGSFSRMDPAGIFFGEMSVAASGDRYVTPGDSVTHAFTVQNLSDESQDYDLEFDSSMGWAVLDALPSTVSLGPDESYVAYVKVRVPSTAFNGEQDEVTLSAAQQSNPLVSASADVTTTAWTGPLIDDISPETAGVGEAITISGHFFGDDPGSGNRSTTQNNIVIGTTQVPDADVSSWSDESITCVVPEGVADGQNGVTVTAGGVASNTFYIGVGETTDEWELSNDSVYFYPNPYDPDAESGRMSFSLSRSGEVTVKIYDATSSLVCTLVEGESRATRTELSEAWDGTNEDGETVANGVYFYVIESTGGEKGVGKVAVLQ